MPHYTLLLGYMLHSRESACYTLVKVHVTPSWKCMLHPHEGVCYPLKRVHTAPSKGCTVLHVNNARCVMTITHDSPCKDTLCVTVHKHGWFHLSKKGRFPPGKRQNNKNLRNNAKRLLNKCFFVLEHTIAGVKSPCAFSTSFFYKI